MPELPEVESLRLGLVKVLLKQKIHKVEVLLPKLVSDKGTKRRVDLLKAEIFVEKIQNQTISKIERRAKNLVFHFESGSILLVHLKMTGQLVFVPTPKSDSVSELITGGHPISLSQRSLPHKHTYVIFELTNGTLYYNDIRQFGYLLYYPSLEDFDSQKHFDKLGLEPLEEIFTLSTFEQKLKNKKGNLKKMFLDQKIVVGLGNIYCDEVCFASGVLPTRNIETLTETEITKLFEAIKNILAKAVSVGGSSVANYLLVDGSKGNYAREHKVYNRANKNCLVCENILQKITLAGRTSVFCTVCQK